MILLPSLFSEASEGFGWTVEVGAWDLERSMDVDLDVAVLDVSVESVFSNLSFQSWFTLGGCCLLLSSTFLALYRLA